MIGVKDPRPEFNDQLKKLTYWPTGDSNNTIIKIGNSEYYYGRKSLQNKWFGGYESEPLPNGRKGSISKMDFTLEKIMVTQHVEIVPGSSGLLDTCLIFYTIRNYGDIPQKVGIRVMMDTFIGANDGVPFTIPDGRRGFLTTMEEFPQKKIPDYIEAIENPNDPNDLGTVVRMQLKGLKLPGVDALEDIETMRICRWPQNKDARWKWEMEPMDFVPETKDSCVVLYWADRDMNPRTDVRQLAFTYGLSGLDIGGDGRGSATGARRNGDSDERTEPGAADRWRGIRVCRDCLPVADQGRTEGGAQVPRQGTDAGARRVGGEGSSRCRPESH